MNEKLRLLELLIRDSKNCSEIFRPGPYWSKKNFQTYKEILVKGIKNFRGKDNNIGESFTDNQNIDILNNYYGGIKGIFKKFFECTYPFNNIFNRQIAITSSYLRELNTYKSHYFSSSEITKELINRFNFDNTVNFGCEDYSLINNQKISHHYLVIADTHNNFKEKIDFDKIKTFFEIGGGFGANVHFLLQNYKNIKKIIYLDLPVNLFIGTEYLKSFYGQSVIDYSKTQNKEIIFQNNNDLEIFCIPPWKIKDIKVKFDLFQNSNSFVEMTKSIIENYAFYLQNNMNNNSIIALSSYNSFDPNRTLDPKNLDTFFNLKFDKFFKKNIIPNKENVYLVSK